MSSDTDIIIKWEGTITEIDKKHKKIYARLLDITDMKEDEDGVADEEGVFPLSDFTDTDDFNAPYLAVGKVFYLILGTQYDDSGNAYDFSEIRIPHVRAWFKPEERKEIEEWVDKVNKWLNDNHT